MKKMIRSVVLWGLLLILLCGCALFDNEPPVIEAKSPQVEYGNNLLVSDIADVTDNYSVDSLTIKEVTGGDANISEDGQTVSFDRPGEYTVLIEAADSRENTSEAQCPVTVIDNTAPVLMEITGVQEIGYGEKLTLVNENDGDVDNALFVKYEDVSNVTLAISSVAQMASNVQEDKYEILSSEYVVFKEPGVYILTVAATDAFGNSSSKETLITAVDKTPPIISGLDRITINEYSALPSLLNNVFATDAIDGDLTQQLTVDSSRIKKGIPGSYKAIYSVSDAAGNVSQRERIIVIEDTTPPVISLSQSSISFTVGNKRPDYKSVVSANDANDGSLTNRVSVDDSQVDYLKPGTYTAKYSVTDNSGNTTTRSIYVTVRAKVTAPTGGSGGTGGTVYITRTGSKYHRSGCRYLSRSKISISRSNAISSGYTPCSVCRP